MGVTGRVTVFASHHWACVPGRIAVVVLVCSTILVAIHCLAAMPGVAAIVIASPWMEFVVAFPGVVDNFSLLPESLDLSRSSRVGVGSRHDEVVEELFGTGGLVVCW